MSILVLMPRRNRVLTPGKPPATSTLPGVPEIAAGGGTTTSSAVPSLLRPQTYECANCAGRFPARNRPTPYCSAQCGAEAKTVRFGRKQRAEFGDELPAGVRASLHRQVVHALTECTWDRWSSEPEPGPVEPPAAEPLADHLNPNIPTCDVFAQRAHRMKVRVLARGELRPCDAQDWDNVWRDWVNAHAS